MVWSIFYVVFEFVLLVVLEVIFRGVGVFGDSMLVFEMKILGVVFVIGLVLNYFGFMVFVFISVKWVFWLVVLVEV